MNFASRTKAKALVGVGLVDTVCPAEGVLATCNLLGGPKQIVIMPRSGHGGEGPGHQAYYAVFGRFLDDARK
jgi:cephalosporin-C deacetylase-like acetyl esterase